MKSNHSKKTKENDCIVVEVIFISKPALLVKNTTSETNNKTLSNIKNITLAMGRKRSDQLTMGAK